MKRTPMTRSRMARTPPPERDWREARRKVAAEGVCRVCGYEAREGAKLEAAHTIGREHDERREPRIVDVPCPVCGAAAGQTCSVPDHDERISASQSAPAHLHVHADDVVPLCAHRIDGTEGCHPRYDGRRLDLLPHLTHAEQARAVGHVGIARALNRLTSGLSLALVEQKEREPS